MTVHIHQNGSQRAAETEDKKLIRFLAELGITIDAPCGSNGTCGKCLVRTENGPPLTDSEKKVLSPKQIAEGWRLACRAGVADGMHVFIDAHVDAVIQIDGAQAEVNLDPAVTVRALSVSLPTLEDSRDNWSRVLDIIPDLQSNPAILPDLPAVLSPAANAVLFDRRLPLAFTKAPVHPYGIAVDIGTTTVVAYLIDLLSGRNIDAASAMNEQRAHGADVISRAQYTASADGLAALTNIVRTQINGLAATLVEKNGVTTDSVYHITFAGNTIMTHLLLGLPVDQIAVSPFAPLITHGVEMSARDMGIKAPRAIATVLPSVAGYIGSDTIAALLACGMDQSGETTLLVDIGTNGEMALAHNGRLLCCSTAAGPAFEGAHIACGMGGVTGAISHVRMNNGALGFDVIGGGSARGICGSGLVDAVAVLLEAQVIDETGRFDSDYLSSLHIEIDGKPAVRLTDDVYLSQKDIREIQLAKGAIAAGIDILLKEAGITPADIRRTCLAGGFGSHIDPAGACRVGILPITLLPTVEAVGNAAGSGARMALLDRNARGRAEYIRTNMRYIELSARPDFQDQFVEKMMFE